MKRLLATAACLAAILCGPPAWAAETIAERWAAAWNSHDVEKIVALFAADGIYQDVPFGTTSRGSAALRNYAKSYFDAVPDMKTVVTGSALAGGRGYIEWTFSGTDVGIYKTNKPFSISGVSIIATRAGKITSDRDHYDLAGLMKQVGVLPK
jgi:steroid delta-isomerase-like uncharacterized protein